MCDPSARVYLFGSIILLFLLLRKKEEYKIASRKQKVARRSGAPVGPGFTRYADAFCDFRGISRRPMVAARYRVTHIFSVGRTHLRIRLVSCTRS